jgi:hypothetical protein
MRLLLLLGIPLLLAAEPPKSPADIDPNTKIEGGVDIRSSGANAGNENEVRDKMEMEKRGEVTHPVPSEEKKDKPTSERKPRERESEEASRGETRQPD